MYLDRNVLQMAASHLFASIKFRKGVAPHQNFSHFCVRRRTFLVLEEGQSLCSKKDIPCVRTKTFLVFEDDETPIFGRTDLRKGVSEAKFDAEADFDVQKCLAPPKSAENREKPKTKSEIFSEKNFGVKTSKVANRPKRVFPKFRGVRIEVRGRTEF